MMKYVFVLCLLVLWAFIWQIAPRLKMARSVVPPPTSTSATPSSFSSAVSTASAAAICSSTISATSMPARLTQLVMLLSVGIAPVTMWTLASRREPFIPTGSRMPSWSSRMKS